MASRGSVQFYILVLYLCISYVYGAVLSSRANPAPACVGLSVKSNDGDRKIAIVIDASFSMLQNDPDDLRIAAGRALNSWLISKAGATGEKKADQVAVVEFSDDATLIYPLGDPEGANASFSNISLTGGTYISSGVQMGMGQVNASSTGTTNGRSSIIVFTDGEDEDPAQLVRSINQATAQGIRVSFGFLDSTASVQDVEILTAITGSGGVYATITSEDASNNFINFAILNGLTYNDNPAGNSNTLLAGLSISQIISGSQTISTFYNAQANERINFTVISITSGYLTAQALLNGNIVAENTTALNRRTGDETTQLAVQAPKAGRFEIKVKAQNAPTDSVYILGATSSDPIQNCSVAVTGDNGSGSLGTGAKVGLGLGVPALVAGLLVGGFFLFKYFGHKVPPFKNPFAKPPPLTEFHEPPTYHGGAEKPGLVELVTHLGSVATATGGAGGTLPLVPPPTSPPPNTKAQDPRQKHRRFKRRKNEEGPYHHHHLTYGHPCTEGQSQCHLLDIDHICKDPEAEPKGPCVCIDKKCPLNDDGHECAEDKNIQPCGCEDGECEVTKQVERKKREKLLLGGAKIAVGQGVKIFAGT